ncbi:response regulator transcription factor [Primorskyibacter sp. S187A]|uniref:response regulator transcription factor n=1 Tax=Primorskyibacter sp. S187A TaxID=3415130 RepID=UPI003C7A2DE2
MAKRVLVVEDEPNIIEAVSFFLSRDGWEVFTHSNGHDALDAVTHRNPDLLILDLMLPGRSGVEILRDLRSDARWENLPVLMLTARGHSRDRAEAEAAGASKFMTKPFSNAEILEAVRELAAP